MKEIKDCLICGNTNLKKLFSCEDYLVTHESFHILQCTNCGFRLTSPLPSVEQLPSYYVSDEYYSHNEKQTNLTGKIYQYVKNYMLRKKYQWVSKHISGKSMLDIGCGTGDVLKYFKNQNWSVTGIEQNKTARRIARDKGLEMYADIHQLNQKRKFDVISLWHVLEHLSDIKEHLDFIKDSLHQKGILVIALPNPESYDAKRYGKYWGAYDVPRHLYHFTSKNVSQLLKKSGFSLIQEIPMKFDAYYVSLLSEKNRSGKNHFLNGFINGFKSNFHAAVNDRNFSSKVYIFKKYINV